MSTEGNLDVKLLRPATGTKGKVAEGGEGSGEGKRGEVGGRRKSADVPKAEYWVLPDSDDEAEMAKWNRKADGTRGGGRGRAHISVTDQMISSVIMAPTLSRMVAGMDWQRQVDIAATKKAAVEPNRGAIIIRPGGTTLEEPITIDDDVGVKRDDFTVMPLAARDVHGNAVDVGTLTAETPGICAADPAEPQEAQKVEVQTRRI